MKFTSLTDVFLLAVCFQLLIDEVSAAAARNTWGWHYNNGAAISEYRSINIVTQHLRGTRATC